MAVIDRNLFSPVGIFFLIVFGIESIVSLLGNGFVIVVISYNWLQSRKMLPCDFLLTTLSLSRFLLQWVSMISQLVYCSFPETYRRSKEQQVFTFSWIYLNIVSLWCATWLNVFYCVKVTNFAHPFFARLKLRIGVLLPRFLGTSILVYVICAVYPVIRYFEDEKWRNLTGNLPVNTSQSEASNTLKVFNILQCYFNAVGFSIHLMASSVLLLSLWRHKKNLKKSSLDTKDLSTQAHLKVMKALHLSLIFYVLYFIAMSLSLTDIFKYGRLERLITDIFISSYPSAHSIILIFTNPKLKKVYTHVLNLRSSP